jgi:hypothetical protein
VIIGSFNFILTSLFRVTIQMWLVLFLSHYKWYQNNLVTPYDIEALHNMDPKKDVRELSGGSCDTPER